MRGWRVVCTLVILLCAVALASCGAQSVDEPVVEEVTPVVDDPVVEEVAPIVDEPVVDNDGGDAAQSEAPADPEAPEGDVAPATNPMGEPLPPVAPAEGDPILPEEVDGIVIDEAVQDSNDMDEREYPEPSGEDTEEDIETPEEEEE